AQAGGVRTAAPGRVRDAPTGGVHAPAPGAGRRAVPAGFRAVAAGRVRAAAAGTVRVAASAALVDPAAVGGDAGPLPWVGSAADPHHSGPGERVAAGPAAPGAGPVDQRRRRGARARADPVR